MKNLNSVFIAYSEIPKHLIKNTWISKYPKHCYVKAHIDENDKFDDLDKWLMLTYPGIEKNTFLIYTD